MSMKEEERTIRVNIEHLNKKICGSLGIRTELLNPYTVPLNELKISIPNSENPIATVFLDEKHWYIHTTYMEAKLEDIYGENILLEILSDIVIAASWPETIESDDGLIQSGLIDRIRDTGKIDKMVEKFKDKAINKILELEGNVIIK